VLYSCILSSSCYSHLISTLFPFVHLHFSSYLGLVFHPQYSQFLVNPVPSMTKSSSLPWCIRFPLCSPSPNFTNIPPTSAPSSGICSIASVAVRPALDIPYHVYLPPLNPNNTLYFNNICCGAWLHASFVVLKKLPGPIADHWQTYKFLSSTSSLLFSPPHPFSPSSSSPFLKSFPPRISHWVIEDPDL
jgi:hypothetical protein